MVFGFQCFLSFRVKVLVANYSATEGFWADAAVTAVHSFSSFDLNAKPCAGYYTISETLVSFLGFWVIGYWGLEVFGLLEFWAFTVLRFPGFVIFGEFSV